MGDRPKPGARGDAWLRLLVTLGAALLFTVLALLRMPTLAALDDEWRIWRALEDSIGAVSLVPVLLAVWSVDVVRLVLGLGARRRSLLRSPRSDAWRAVVVGAAVLLLWLAVEQRLSSLHSLAPAFNGVYRPWASDAWTRVFYVVDVVVELAICLAVTRRGLVNGFSLWLGVHGALLLVPSFSPEPFWQPHPFFQPGWVVVPVALLLALLLVRPPTRSPTTGDARATHAVMPRLAAGLLPLWIAFWCVLELEHHARFGESLSRLYAYCSGKRDGRRLTPRASRVAGPTARK